MRRCGCNVSCPSWPPTWRGRWEVFSQWFVTKAWPFCRRWSWVLVVAALIGLGFWLPTTTKFKSVLAWIRNLDTIYAVLAFVSIQTLLTVLFLPGALFVLMAGYTLDFWIGTLVAWTGSVLGALGAFIIGRQLLADRVRKWANDSPFFLSVMKAIDSADEGWKITILLRLSPLMPYALINYLLSSTQLTFWTYAWCTTVGILPPTALYVYLGTTAASLSDILGDAFGDDDDSPSAPAPVSTPATPYAPDAPYSPLGMDHSPYSPIEPAPTSPIATPSAMDTTSLWVMGIGVVATVVVAVLVTVFTSRAIKRASRIVPGGVEEAIADDILDGSSATDDDNMVSLDNIEDDLENSVQMKDMSTPQIRANLRDLELESDDVVISLDPRLDASADDSDPEEDVLSRSSANSTTPFNLKHSPVASRHNANDPRSSV